MAGPSLAFDHDVREIICKVRYACYSSLAFIVWEWLLTFSFEVDFIWRKETPRYTKLLYSTPRYLGLISLICNGFAMSRIQMIYLVNQETCRWWYGFQLITSDVMLLSLEILLMVRIFALYGRGQYLAVFLGAVLSLKTTAIIILSILTLCRITFSDACLVERAPSTVVYTNLLEMVVQTLFWTATLYKHLRTRWKTGWQNIPLLSLVTRDSTFTFTLFLVLYIISMIDAINRAGVGMPGKSRVLTTLAFRDMVFPILVAVTSLSSCRLIMNMQTFTSREPEDCEVEAVQDEGELQLTTLSDH